MDNVDLVKIFNFCSAKALVTRMTRQATDREEIFTNPSGASLFADSVFFNLPSTVVPTHLRFHFLWFQASTPSGLSSAVYRHSVICWMNGGGSRGEGRVDQNSEILRFHQQDPCYHCFPKLLTLTDLWYKSYSETIYFFPQTLMWPNGINLIWKETEDTTSST